MKIVKKLSYFSNDEQKMLEDSQYIGLKILTAMIELCIKYAGGIL